MGSTAAKGGTNEFGNRKDDNVSSHYVSLPRGNGALIHYADYTSGASSNATAVFEFRVLDGVTPQRVEVTNALEAFRRFFENPQLWVPAAFDVKG